jgi:NitT/TauT family transport system ATP-binding protein
VYLSDRVFVLAGSPARFAAELTLDLPRPRSQVTTKESPAYLKARHTVHEALRSGAAR